MLLLIGLIESFGAVIALIVVWGLLFAASVPIRQAYLNDRIPSEQRATILSFDSLMSSSGGVVEQPILGRAADVWGYPASYLLSGGISALALPFLARARRLEPPAGPPDRAGGGGADPGRRPPRAPGLSGAARERGGGWRSWRPREMIAPAAARPPPTSGGAR